MEKCVVYSGTRNVYDDIVPALKSLLKNSQVDRVFILIEDDKFPQRLPEECEVINVSKYAERFKDSPNFNNFWSWMVLVRLVYTEVFADLDQILSLDNDTIVNRDISELWDIDMTGYYFAGCREMQKTRELGYLYVNAGVLMYNLAELRRDGMSEKFVKDVHENTYVTVEQDVMNKLSYGKILELDPTYNRAIGVTLPSQDPKVFHFAGFNDWRDFHEIKRYRDVPWREIL